MSRKYNQTSDEVDPRHRSSKDTARWCRGRVGVEHKKQWKPTEDRWERLPQREHLECVECGRQFFEYRSKEWAIHELLRAIREHQEVSQEQLASFIGTTQPRIAAIEKGEQMMNLSTLTKMCEGLSVDCEIKIANFGTSVLRTQRKRW